MHKQDKYEVEIKPIATNPQYIEAAEKLADYQKRRHAITSELALIEAKLANQSALSQPSYESMINAADLLIAGKVETPITGRISELNYNLGTLNKAIEAQRYLIKEINNNLSIEVGLNLMAKHKAIAVRIANAIDELHEANKLEWQIRYSLVLNGYLHSNLPVMAYMAAHDPKDQSGTAAYYWKQWADSYIA